jgi:hypothetical protein
MLSRHFFLGDGQERFLVAEKVSRLRRMSRLRRFRDN